MTVAEQIKRRTAFNSNMRTIACSIHAVKHKNLMRCYPVFCNEFTFIDGSKLTCRVYW
jgi:hypothetical protein